MIEGKTGTENRRAGGLVPLPPLEPRPRRSRAGRTEVVQRPRAAFQAAKQPEILCKGCPSPGLEAGTGAAFQVPFAERPDGGRVRLYQRRDGADPGDAR